MRSSSPFFRILTLASAGMLLWAAAWSIRLGWADYLRHQPDLASVTRSTELDPLNAQGYRAKALYEELAGQDSQNSWRKAVELDPRNPEILIPAAIQAEMKGDLYTAEYCLRSAERHNRLWLPRWTLANFYARRGNPAQTLLWLKAALARSYGGALAAFQLALDSGITEEEVAAQILTDGAHPHGQFMLFLCRQALTNGRARLLESIAGRYVTLEREVAVSRRDGFPLMTALNRLLADGYGGPARRIWNLGCENKLIDSVPAAGESMIVNGDFGHPFVGEGLDWSLARNEQITSLHHPGPGTVKFTFSGHQEGTLVLLSQTVVVPRGMGWKVSFEFQTDGIAPRQASFAWKLGDESLPLATTLASDTWVTNSFMVLPSDLDRISRLALIISRPLGAVRPEGDLWIRSLRAERIP